MSKLTLLTAAAAGYVLGARAGRERYEQIAAGARKVAGNPRVQAARQQAQDVVAEQAGHVKDVAAEKAKGTASSVASTVTEKMHRGGDGGTHAATTATTTASTDTPGTGPGSTTGPDTTADGTWPTDSGAPQH
jgi:hypothetical protein